ncbi:ethylene-responsive transcription factor ERF014-like [Salvia splendens]|uniref:ethylene-responsive transcription factor ERF014-like n=1 Tax=Salvia splendens TaxID=180675 RepID=UPI001C270B56|nr:ethylene-responsive transcription factor ERF014-like [Salvia splendens]
MKMVKKESKIPSKPNSPPPSSSLKKRFKGVRMRTWGSWVSEIRAPNQKTRIWLGSYSTAEAAARAYDAALLCLKGPKANLNFPKSNQTLNIPDDQTAPMSPKSIQKIAAAAALLEGSEESNPPSPDSSSSSSSSLSLMSLSPSISSSSIDDDLILLAAADCDGGGGSGGGGDGEMSWYNFESPKYYEMMNGVFFDSSMVMGSDYGCCVEEEDIRLWSF